MAHHEKLFPTGISYGSSGGPSFSTEIIELDAGAENRVGRWPVPRHRYDVANGVKSDAALYALKEFFIARLGALHSFNYKDFSDYATTSTGTTHNDGDAAVAEDDVALAAGTGSGDTTRQMQKVYAAGTGYDRTRTITKPVSGTVKVAVNSVTKTEGVDYTVDYTTGIITFSSDLPSGHSVTFGCEFYVPVRFEKTTDDWLESSLDSFNNGSLRVELIEVTNALDTPEDFFYGGAYESTLTGDTQMAVGTARLWTLLPDASGHELRLPDKANLQPGGPYFFINNLHASNTIALTESDSTAVMTINGNSGVTVVLTQDNAGVKEWAAF